MDTACCDPIFNPASQGRAPRCGDKSLGHDESGTSLLILAQPWTGLENEAIWGGVSSFIKCGHLTLFRLPLSSSEGKADSSPGECLPVMSLKPVILYSVTRQHWTQTMASSGLTVSRTLFPFHDIWLGMLSSLVPCREDPSSASCLTSLSKASPLSKGSFLSRHWHF